MKKPDTFRPRDLSDLRLSRRSFLKKLTAVGAGFALPGWVRANGFDPSSLVGTGFGVLTGPECYALHLVNRLRENMRQELNRLGISAADVNPKNGLDTVVPRLAPNEMLTIAARLHSQDMVKNAYLSHTSLDGRTPEERVAATGYPLTICDENINGGGTRCPLDSRQVDQFHKSLIKSSGHLNSMVAQWQETGFGLHSEMSLFKGCYYGAITEVFGDTWSWNSYLTGLVMRGNGTDDLYVPGRGIGGVKLDIYGNDNYTTFTDSSGSYSVSVAPGTYNVVAMLPDGATENKTVAVGEQNKYGIKNGHLDFYLGGDDQADAFDTTMNFDYEKLGDEPGEHAKTLPADEIRSLMVNVTNSAGEAPKPGHEWLFAVIGKKKGLDSPVWVMQDNPDTGGYMWNRLAVHNGVLKPVSLSRPATTEVMHIGDFAPRDLAMESGDTLLYGYGYVPDKPSLAGVLADVKIENKVVVKVE